MRPGIPWWKLQSCDGYSCHGTGNQVDDSRLEEIHDITFMYSRATTVISRLVADVTIHHHEIHHVGITFLNEIANCWHDVAQNSFSTMGSTVEPYCRSFRCRFLVRRCQNTFPLVLQARFNGIVGLIGIEWTIKIITIHFELGLKIR